MAKVTQLQKNEIVRLEATLNNLWGELNTATIPHHVRQELEQKLAGCEEQFKSVLGGQSSSESLQNNLHEIDMKLAFAMVGQAENEVSKTEHKSAFFQALENIRKGLVEGSLSPTRARHEVKDCIRHHKS